MSESLHTGVGKHGRIVIPAQSGALARITEGTELTARVGDSGEVVIDTPQSIKSRIRARASEGSDVPGSVVEELLAERTHDRSLLH